MIPPKRRRRLFGDFTLERLLISVAEIYVCLIIFGLFFSERAIFHPQSPGYLDSPAILKIPVGSERIAARYLPNPAAEFTILFSHGNAEDIGDLQPFLELYRKAGYALFAYDYRGYGHSNGHPTEANARRDIEVAYDYLVNTLGVRPDRIILHGRSVGSGPTMHLATRKPLAGLIIQSGFVTAFRVMTVVPIVPFDRFRNIDAIGQIHCPVLVMHGEADHVIAFWHGQSLFKAAPNPKINLWVTGAGHDDFVEVAGPRYWEALRHLTDMIHAAQTTPGAKSN